MKRLKLAIIISVALIALFFVFIPVSLPENFQLQQVLNSRYASNEILVVFNSGGLGHTPLEKSDDFLPVIKGIEETLNEKGYKTVVVSYNRTKDNFWGEITGVKGFFNSFKQQSEDLSSKIEDFLNENPQNKVIIAGLSQGGAFADETTEKLNDFQDRVFTIEAGVPFWQKKISSENILRLDNNGKDPLVRGDIKTLIFNLFESPLKWISAKIARSNLTFIGAIHAPGHDYSWPDLKPQVISFLDNKLK
jgi:hypothetical protein